MGRFELLRRAVEDVRARRMEVPALQAGRFLRFASLGLRFASAQAVTLAAFSRLNTDERFKAPQKPGKSN